MKIGFFCSDKIDNLFTFILILFFTVTHFHAVMPRPLSHSQSVVTNVTIKHYVGIVETVEKGLAYCNIASSYLYRNLCEKHLHV